MECSRVWVLVDVGHSYEGRFVLENYCDEPHGQSLVNECIMVDRPNQRQGSGCCCTPIVTRWSSCLSSLFLLPRFLPAITPLPGPGSS